MCNFAPLCIAVMYSLKEGWIKMHGQPPVENWDGRMYCGETDATLTFRTNRTEGFMAAYSFTIVTAGWLTFMYNGKEVTLQKDDLYVYSPGLAIMVLSASDDYHGVCLIADENLTIEMPAVRDIARIAYKPLVQLHEPKLSLPHDMAVEMTDKIREIARYIHSDHIYKMEILRMLYSVFLLDLQNAQEKAMVERIVPQRVEEIFISFIHLLPRYFTEQHGIPFYADALNITPTYLSRVVRQVTGRTVVEYINQMLLMESYYLLQTSTLSISQIADQLHFADTPSFSKFFSRLSGMSPREYREKRR